jgi:phage tail protein X
LRPSNVLIAHDGETLDGLIWRGAGLGPSALPEVCSANTRVCERLTLSAGDRIMIPAGLLESPNVTPTRSRVQLWD